MLLPLEKITQFNGEEEDTWYEEMGNLERAKYTNPYYAIVEIEGKKYPLPFFFEARRWELLGHACDTMDGEFMHLKNQLPEWVLEWVNRYSMPVSPHRKGGMAKGEIK